MFKDTMSLYVAPIKIGGSEDAPEENLILEYFLKLGTMGKTFSRHFQIFYLSIPGNKI